MDLVYNYGNINGQTNFLPKTKKKKKKKKKKKREKVQTKVNIENENPVYKIRLLTPPNDSRVVKLHFLTL